MKKFKIKSKMFTIKNSEIKFDFYYILIYKSKYFKIYF